MGNSRYNFHMDFLPILILIFILGTFIGSLLNVIILRYNTGLSYRKGRSICFHCGRKLSWFELIPVVSFFVLRAKCRTCKSSLSWQYPAVEVLTGLIFVAVVLRQYFLWPIYSAFEYGFLYSVLFAIYYFVIWSLLILIAAYDLRHKIIPNPFVYTLIFLGLAKLILFAICKGSGLTSMDILDLTAPLFLFVPFALLWFFSDGRWIGFGDAKLVLGIGAVVGFISGLSTIVLAFWVGALWSVGFIVISEIFAGKSRKVGFRSEVPFAPFIIFAALFVFFTRVDILGVGTILGFFS